MKVLFIGIENILSFEKITTNQNNNPCDFITDQNMRLLEFLVKLTDAKIVLTDPLRVNWSPSTVQCNSVGEFINCLFSKYNLEIYDKTDMSNQGNKDYEISEWLKRNKGQMEKFVIIDDSTDEWSVHNKKHLVKIDSKAGINEETVENCINILTTSNEMQHISDEQWERLTGLIKTAVCQDIYEIFFENQFKPIGFFPDGNLVAFYVNSRSRFFVEEVLLDKIQAAVKAVFGKEAEYIVEDDNIHSKFWIGKNPEIRAFKLHKRICEVLKKSPHSIFFTQNIHSEIFHRLILIFANLSEQHMTDCIKVTRIDKNRIEIYSNDKVAFKLDMVNESYLFRRSDYEYIMGSGYERQYLPCPFHCLKTVRATRFDESFYANVDSYMSMFMLLHLSSNVVIESVKNGIFSKIACDNGFNVAEAVGCISDKENGTYITYSVDENDLSDDEIRRILKTIALLCKGLKVSFCDSKGEAETYCYGNIGYYMNRLESTTMQPYFANVVAKGRDRYNLHKYAANVEVAFCFVEEKDANTEGYYNHSRLQADNVISEKMLSVVTDKLNCFLEGKTSNRLCLDDIKNNSHLIFDVRTSDDFEPWQPERKEDDVDLKRMIGDLSEDVFEGFVDWLNEEENQSELIKIIFDIFTDKDNREYDEFFPDGMK